MTLTDPCPNCQHPGPHEPEPAPVPAGFCAGCHTTFHITGGQPGPAELPGPVSPAGDPPVML